MRLTSLFPLELDQSQRQRCADAANHSARVANAANQNARVAKAANHNARAPRRLRPRTRTSRTTSSYRGRQGPTSRRFLIGTHRSMRGPIT